MHYEILAHEQPAFVLAAAINTAAPFAGLAWRTRMGRMVKDR
jgi:hypothetical protein